MRVAFITDTLNLRGMAVATYDYANHNENVLGNESFVFYQGTPSGRGTLDAYAKFRNRFKSLTPFDTYPELHALIEKNKIDYTYRLSWGHNESKILDGKTSPWGIHVVFKRYHPYGDKYAYISEWLRNISHPKSDFVPHIIDLPKVDTDLRSELGISPDKFVFGGLGDVKSFNIPFVINTVKKALDKRSDLVFAFLNFEKFCDHERCIFLPGTYDLEYKTNFINTCDAMIHARLRGETFGLSVGEFSARNKRIATYSMSTEREHYRILGDKALLYKDEKDLMDIFMGVTKVEGDFDCYSKQFSPTNVMAQFSKVFLNKEF